MEFILSLFGYLIKFFYYLVILVISIPLAGIEMIYKSLNSFIPTSGIILIGILLAISPILLIKLKKLNKKIKNKKIKNKIKKIEKEFEILNGESRNIVYNKTYPCSNFKGDLQERKLYFKTELKNVDYDVEKYKRRFKLVNDEVFFIDNFPTFNINLWFSKFYKEPEIEFLNKILPISFFSVFEIEKRMNFLLAEIKVDIENIRKNYNILLKGEEGEQEVFKMLEKHNNRYKILKNIRLKYKGHSSESDVIIISPKGIFVVEIKNYGKEGKTIRIDQNNKWYLVDNKSGNESEITSGTEQNQYHCEQNEIFINKELEKKGYIGDRIKCYSIVCVSNNEVDLQNESDSLVVRKHEIAKTIEKVNTSPIDKEIQIFTEEILNRYSVPEKKYEIIGYSEKITKEFKELNLLIDISYHIQSILDKYNKLMNKR